MLFVLFSCDSQGIIYSNLIGTASSPATSVKPVCSDQTFFLPHEHERLAYEINHCSFLLLLV